MASKNNLSVVFDIGTSKIVALAGQKDENNKLEVLAMANVVSSGIKRGTIFNIEEAVSSIQDVVDQLESQIKENITEVDVAFAAQQMKIHDYKGSRLISKDGIVSKTDIEELYKGAKNLDIEQDFKVLHVIPQSYTIDEEVTEMNPVGITGQKIEARYKVITVPLSQTSNIERAFEKVGIKVGKISLSLIALADSVLTDEEKEIGVILLDIGAGTTKIAAFHNNVMVHTAVIPFGGNVITADIKEGCFIHQKWAEQLKVEYGQALGDFAKENELVTIPSVNGWESKEISVKSLSFIIQARLEEIIDSVYYQIEKSGISDKLGSGIIVTGGTSKLNNIISLVKFRTGFDARIAFPVIYPLNKQKEFKNQELFTALGLLKNALNKNEITEKPIKIKKKKEGGLSPWIKNVVQGVLDYIDDDEDMKYKVE